MLLAAGIFSAVVPAAASSWDWTKILGSSQGSDSSSQTSSTVTNLLEGIFSRTDITVADMAGTWTVDGSAVAFKSEDFLSQAGGTAAAAAIQTEIDPYYERYGLTGATVTVDSAGNCNIKLRKGALKGKITPEAKGEFLFNLTILGQPVGSVPLYVRKTSKSMDMMFDVAKMKQILNTLAKFSGNSLAQSVVKILDKYQGVYVGFGMHADTAAQQNTSTSSPSALGTLRDILTGRKK